MSLEILHPLGRVVIDTRTIAAGELRITRYDYLVHHTHDGEQTICYTPRARSADLNGLRVMDPKLCQQYAKEAGLALWTDGGTTTSSLNGNWDTTTCPATGSWSSHG